MVLAIDFCVYFRDFYCFVRDFYERLNFWSICVYINSLSLTPLHNNTMALQNRYITLYYYAKFEVLCPSLRSPQAEGLCPPTTPLAGNSLHPFFSSYLLVYKPASPLGDGRGKTNLNRSNAIALVGPPIKI